ncbi:response regulator [Microaerobacter geothermalis]|uniref:response regulator n=1 Tax=Microaerobacter geothermalis TaxID=674972 RepID=UPI001F48BA7A|nr:response regulator [Microaerobacter geothermalis]MCF6092893.1 response regulator [Microaerobacter geothermalis]
MVRLFVADDEQIVTDSLRFIVESSFSGQVELVGSAKSGREAIEKVELLKPDLVFMDIQMPGINGIEAISKIKSRHPDIIFVIISAYEHFNYAKEAVNLGVMEYILKPMDKQGIIEVIRNAQKLVEMNRENMFRELELREKLNQMIPFIESEFIYTYLFNTGLANDLTFYEELFAMKLNYGFVLICHILPEKEDVRYSLDKHKFYQDFRTNIKNLCKCLVGSPMLNTIIVYIPVSEQEDAYEIKNYSLRLAQEIIGETAKRSDLSFKIGIGRAYPITGLSKSTEEAERVINVSGMEEIIHFEDLITVPGKTEVYPSYLERELIDRLLGGNLIGAIASFQNIYDWIFLNCQEGMQEAGDRLSEVVIAVEKTLSYYFNHRITGQAPQITGSDLIEEGELRNRFIHWVKKLSQQINDLRVHKFDGLITRVIEFINRNYDQNITLNDAAKEINMSYHYFSKFFKERTGQNFTDYLTVTRINKAKEFLADKTLSIKEISFKVGYNDPNYFCKIFKRITGMTPSEFRN